MSGRKGRWIAVLAPALLLGCREESGRALGVERMSEGPGLAADPHGQPWAGPAVGPDAGSPADAGAAEGTPPPVTTSPFPATVPPELTAPRR